MKNLTIIFIYNLRMSKISIIFVITKARDDLRRRLQPTLYFPIPNFNIILTFIIVNYINIIRTFVMY